MHTLAAHLHFAMYLEWNLQLKHENLQLLYGPAQTNDEEAEGRASAVHIVHLYVEVGFGRVWIVTF